ncbi:MAG TPA: MarR family transcriptional regulator [Myxococcaceae bacterium]|nr:MarR family transcriptional regulator [Myxococcaceae bacterium]
MGTHAIQLRRNDAREVMEAIRRIVQRLRVFSRRAEREQGLSGPQLFVLQLLADHPDQSVGALAERTLTHQSTVSTVVAPLIKKGLVSRRSDEADGRRVALNLTRAGQAVLQRSPTAPQAALIRALERLPGRTRRSLADGLNALLAEMGAASASPAPLFFDEGRN